MVATGYGFLHVICVHNWSLVSYCCGIFGLQTKTRSLFLYNSIDYIFSTELLSYLLMIIEF